jgi:DNA-directed RNA polymerase specialized sigma24 family protein
VDSTSAFPSTSTVASLPDVNPELIDGVVGLTVRKYHLSWQDADDLRSTLWVKLLDRDGHVLRRFAGRSTLATYLTRVASRIVLDNYAARFGRWRPSAEARRQGPAAVDWARLVERDGHSPEHARAILERRRAGESLDGRSGSVLETAVTRRYRPRQFVELTEVRSLAAGSGLQGVPLGGRLGLLTARRRVALALRVALRMLTPHERRLVRLRYCDGMRISDIARRERCRVVPLYRQYARILKKMRNIIGAANIDADMVACALEPPAAISSSLEGLHRVVA